MLIRESYLKYDIGDEDMQDKIISVLTDKENQFTEDLKLLGVDTKTAKVMTYLCLVGPATSRELELSADMRQPDVSRGIKSIRDFVKTDNDGRHLRFSMSKPDVAITSAYDKILKVRAEQDAAYERIQKAMKKPAKASKKAAKKPKVVEDDDEELTLTLKK